MSNKLSPELLRMLQVTQAELDIWRERYPHSAGFVAEEARAKVEGREPIFGPPLVIGSAST